MREAPGLARAAVNGDAHVDDVADLAEEVVEFAVGHVEGHVADEEGAGGGGGAGRVAVGAREERGAGGGVLDGEGAAFEGFVVEGFDGLGGGGGGGEVYVAETVGVGVLDWGFCVCVCVRGCRGSVVWCLIGFWVVLF